MEAVYDDMADAPGFLRLLRHWKRVGTCFPPVAACSDPGQ